MLLQTRPSRRTPHNTPNAHCVPQHTPASVRLGLGLGLGLGLACFSALAAVCQSAAAERGGERKPRATAAAGVSVRCLQMPHPAVCASSALTIKCRVCRCLIPQQAEALRAVASDRHKQQKQKDLLRHFAQRNEERQRCTTEQHRGCGGWIVAHHRMKEARRAVDLWPSGMSVARRLKLVSSSRMTDKFDNSAAPTRHIKAHSKCLFIEGLLMLPRCPIVQPGQTGQTCKTAASSKRAVQPVLRALCARKARPQAPVRDCSSIAQIWLPHVPAQGVARANDMNVDVPSVELRLLPELL